MTERFVPGSSGSISAYVEKHHTARYRWAVASLAGVSGTVVDVASGAGYGSHMIACAVPRRVVGIDASPDAVAGAQAAYHAPGLEFVTGDAQSLSGIADRSVAALVSFETIEHLPRPHEFLRAAARVLRDDGLLLVSTPNRRLASTLYPLRGRPSNPFHLFEYTPDAFWADLEREFDISARLGQGFVPHWLAFWPMQVAIKTVCRLLQRFGAYALADRIYHDPQDVEVTPLVRRPGCAPSILLAECRPRRRAAGLGQ